MKEPNAKARLGGVVNINSSLVGCKLKQAIFELASKITGILESIKRAA